MCIYIYIEPIDICIYKYRYTHIQAGYQWPSFFDVSGCLFLLAPFSSQCRVTLSERLRLADRHGMDLPDQVALLPKRTRRP